MKALMIVLSALLLASPVTSQAQAPEVSEIVQPAGSLDLPDFSWVKRPVVVFADTAADPRYVEQIDMLTAELGALQERDVVVLLDTDPAARSPLRQRLRPRGFMIVVIDKDGNVVLRKPSPWSVRELSRVIDKLPMRIDEMRVKRGEF